MFKGDSHEFLWLSATRPNINVRLVVPLTLSLEYARMQGTAVVATDESSQTLKIAALTPSPSKCCSRGPPLDGRFVRPWGRHRK